MNQRFEMNGKSYLTSREVLDVLRSIVPPSIAAGDMSAVEFYMAAALLAGFIREER